MITSSKYQVNYWETLNKQFQCQLGEAVDSDNWFSIIANILHSGPSNLNGFIETIETILKIIERYIKFSPLVCVDSPAPTREYQALAHLSEPPISLTSQTNHRQTHKSETRHFSLSDKS